MVSGRFQVVLDGFRLFQVVPCFSKCIDVLIKKCSKLQAYPENSVGKGGLTK